MTWRELRGARPERALEVALEQGGVLREGERVLVACSGGPDSVALAALLAGMRARFRLSLSLAHVNHALRPSAWQDEAVVVSVGAIFDLPVDTVSLAGGRSDEAALRKARYGALRAIASARAATAIATGHNAEDQTETLLLALFRGTGLGGLRGMPPRRPLADGVDLARPVLRLERGSLRRYCHRRSLPYALDPSNASTHHRRNAVRAALEALRPAFPGLDSSVARAAEVVRQEVAATRRGTLRRQLRELLRDAGASTEVSFRHIEAAVMAIERKRSGCFFMSSGVALQVEQGAVAVRRAK
ncbi:MAG: tRNA lysidine(34) synthetase TilS [Candidatus Eremiobacteraeota bacterium]|nr:tRNA lysidine(34) synthetase TilS [Candidatus Eremiobacteraeota bacterium]